jgi:hypothetical protein
MAKSLFKRALTPLSPMNESYMEQDGSMKLETFPMGNIQQRYQSNSFEPVPVNHEWKWEDATINILLEKGNHIMGELNVFSLIVPILTFSLKCTW